MLPLLVVIVVFLVYGICTGRSLGDDRLSIACLVICNESQPRWKIEKELWRQTRVPKNVDVYILDCNDKNNDLHCVENMAPGIYQKSLQGFKTAVHKRYDLYIRTNANTHVDFDTINEMWDPLKEKIKSSKPFFTGGIVFRWGVSGTSIVLNHSAASELVDRGFDHKYYYAKYPDDVAISNVLKDSGIAITRNDGFKLYIWDPKKDFLINDTMRAVHKSPFVRIRNVSLTDERRIRHHLSNK